MEQKKKKRGGVGSFFLALLLILVLLCGAAAGFLALWAATSRPAIILGRDSVTIEAGDPFYPKQVPITLEHASENDLIADASAVKTDVPGDYQVTYSLREPQIEQIAERFSHNERKTAVLKVHVADTTPPVLSVIEGPYVAGLGKKVPVTDFVRDTEDLSEVTVTFEDGSSECLFAEEGTSNVKVLASDSSGNVVSATVEVIAKAPDAEPPRIYGLGDVVLQTGTPFDVMEGVTVRDNDDEKPKLTCSEVHVDTSRAGVTVLRYTAEDILGNSSSQERKVTVADRVGSHNGVLYPIYWDNTGVANQPYFVAVNRLQNVATVYQADASGAYTVPVRVCLVSTGKDTPEGRFVTEERYRWRYLYEDSWGQYATRIHEHILFHSVPYNTQNPGDLEYEEFNLLGTSASLGCIRMCVEDVKWIYDNCPPSFPCCIYDADDPGPLGKPEALLIDPQDEAKRGWDPTDPDPQNPYLAPAAAGTAESGPASDENAAEPAESAAELSAASGSPDPADSGDTARILEED